MIKARLNTRFEPLLERWSFPYRSDTACLYSNTEVCTCVVEERKKYENMTFSDLSTGCHFFLHTIDARSQNNVLKKILQGEIIIWHFPMDTRLWPCWWCRHIVIFFRDLDIVIFFHLMMLEKKHLWCKC